MPSDEEAAGPVAPGRAKLVERKQQWAREGRLLTGTTTRPEADRLPPGQRLVRDFPVLDLGVQPAIPLERWRLRLDGLIARPCELDWAGLQALPQEERVNDIHCVTAWSRFDNAWRGVGVATLLDLVRPLPEARHVLLHGADGYTTNLTLAAFARAENLLATHWAGEPLTRPHGGPVRAVIPHLYFWKSAKWLCRIEFLAEDRPGFWAVGGYHPGGDPWAEERDG
ncbi:MAG: sulfite oxidase-like oxidoreductase [Rhodovarius sp.]|nr:sulfite oxidase-like oxidoreductase [Rhodovarius sp.]